MGIFARIKKAWYDSIVWETIDEEFYDELEESLIMADLGAAVAHDAVKKLRDVVYQKSIQSGEGVKQALREILIEKLNVGGTALDLSTKPSIVLVIGVNGVGKTTSIGKLAHRMKGEGRRAVIRDSVFLGLNTHYFVEMETGEEAEIIQESRIDSILEPGTNVRLTLNADKANVFDFESQKSLMCGVHNEAEVR